MDEFLSLLFRHGSNNVIFHYRVYTIYEQVTSFSSKQANPITQNQDAMPRNQRIGGGALSFHDILHRNRDKREPAHLPFEFGFYGVHTVGICITSNYPSMNEVCVPYGVLQLNIVELQIRSHVSSRSHPQISCRNVRVWASIGGCTYAPEK
ncbi:uncharacterized protein BO72DRAFT_82279 [Aspergillus fijiensis CBS 313.89]|uniref:Uncharacterized protein n=1 Tax=Aspergillus fijiensis CBS 313.89 TaxID=1448319 RepID=A0A8G1RR56_9EURO|nr:uncharacterized protein BO72DRAFT_82279 [Aspergillus fijiensis CBS 313.89]RAK77960.1 hypothetical protein BO72DRAFT_82279 [Aspergillus fijiensis CBS 313.89]